MRQHKARDMSRLTHGFLRTRRLCFGDAALDGPAPEGLTWAVVNLSVTVRDASARADEPFRPACGDALRVRFTSRRALFAPRRVPTAALCGGSA